ncbi:MAG: hypothetical protein IIC70_02790 [Acidobacteria bacterium]|nr:hypothetical protein [Acidobacteriota bacterium]
MDVMIGIDPHKGSHTAVVIDQDEVVIAEARVTHKIPLAKKKVVASNPTPGSIGKSCGMGSL